MTNILNHLMVAIDTNIIELAATQKTSYLNEKMMKHI